MLLVGSRTYNGDLIFQKKQQPLKPDGELLTKLIILSYGYFIPLLGYTFVSTLEYPLYCVVVRSA